MSQYTDPTPQETDKAIKLLAKHQHQFTIPVEWRYSGNPSNTYQSAAPDTKKVTKLRCPCGEEIER
jgi:hypothetical protein